MLPQCRGEMCDGRHDLGVAYVTIASSGKRALEAAGLSEQEARIRPIGGEPLVESLEIAPDNLHVLLRHFNYLRDGASRRFIRVDQAAGLDRDGPDIDAIDPPRRPRRVKAVSP
jgi:hypothetical protein